ncbi:MAG: DUF6089 family protein [Cytophagales bacterium]|nr:DUF6089 family protein [Cytophagales bacterium]
MIKVFFSRRLYLGVFFTLLGFGRANAQFFEFGGGFDGLFYQGDLSPLGFKNPRSGIHAITRMNISNVWAVCVNATWGSLEGVDAEPEDILATRRNAIFRSNLAELRGSFEYNFLDYRDDKINFPISPYIFGGIGMMYYANPPVEGVVFSPIQIILPFGVGLKYLAAKRVGLNLSFDMRHSFFDYLDGTSQGNIGDKDYQFGDRFSFDSYHGLNITVTYLLYQIKCVHRPVPKEVYEGIYQRQSW